MKNLLMNLLRKRVMFFLIIQSFIDVIYLNNIYQLAIKVMGSFTDIINEHYRNNFPKIK